MNGSPHTYLIIGCGHFGSRAAEKLLKKDPQPKIVVVDKNKKALRKVSHLPVEIAMNEGVSYLEQFLSRGQETDYVIPAVPFHLAFEFIQLRLRPLGAKRVKVPVLLGVPNPVAGKTGDLYTSFADFLCSEDCPEPAQYCTITRKRRPKPLFKILRELKGTFQSKVIRSHQLTLGVGGFQPEVLLVLPEDIKKKINPGRLILVSTASRCHGVTSALSL